MTESNRETSWTSSSKRETKSPNIRGFWSWKPTRRRWKFLHAGRPGHQDPRGAGPDSQGGSDPVDTGHGRPRQPKSPPPAATPSAPTNSSAIRGAASGRSGTPRGRSARERRQRRQLRRRVRRNPNPEPQDLVPAETVGPGPGIVRSRTPIGRPPQRSHSCRAGDSPIRPRGGCRSGRRPGSGTGGRVTREDILEVVRRANRAVKDAGTSAADQDLPGAPAHDEYGPIRVETASKIRRTIAARMHQSWETIPRVTNFDDADVTELEKIRRASKEDYAANDIKLTTMPFIVKAVSMALRKHPLINATLRCRKRRDHLQEIRQHRHGRRFRSRPDRASFAEYRSVEHLGNCARLVASTAERVRRNEFGLEDLRGSSFTISNLGAVGGTYSTPIINLPEVAILLTGRIAANAGRVRRAGYGATDDAAQSVLRPPDHRRCHRRTISERGRCRIFRLPVGYSWPRRSCVSAVGRPDTHDVSSQLVLLNIVRPKRTIARGFPDFTAGNGRPED